MQVGLEFTSPNNLLCVDQRSNDHPRNLFTNLHHTQPLQYHTGNFSNPDLSSITGVLFTNTTSDSPQSIMGLLPETMEPIRFFQTVRFPLTLANSGDRIP